MGEQLTRNFAKNEMTCRCCGKGAMSPLFMSHLQELRDMYGQVIDVNSACRCPAHNKKVGGAPGSRHLIVDSAGKPREVDAVDIDVTNELQLYELLECAVHLGYFRGIGIGANLLHLDGRPGRPACWVYKV